MKMCFNNQKAGMNVRLAGKEFLFFCGITLLCICFYSKAIIRLSIWQNVTVCWADILCMLTQPSEFVFPCLFVSVLCGYKQYRYQLALSYTVRSKSRVNLYLSQLKTVVFTSVFAAVWMLACAVFVCSVLVPVQLNWAQYSSMYFRYTQTLSAHSFTSIFAVCGASLLLTIATVNVVFLILRRCTGKTLPIVIVVLSLIYFADARLPLQYSLYFKRFAVLHLAFEGSPGLGWTLVGQAVILLIACVLGAFLVKRKDIM